MGEKPSVQKTLQGWEQTFVEYLLYVSHWVRHFTVHLTLATTRKVSIVISDSQMGPWSLREGQWLEVTQLGSGGTWNWIKVNCHKTQLSPPGLKIITTAASTTICGMLTTLLTCISSFNPYNNPVMLGTIIIPISYMRKPSYREVLSDRKIFRG